MNRLHSRRTNKNETFWCRNCVSVVVLKFSLDDILMRELRDAISRDCCIDFGPNIMIVSLSIHALGNSYERNQI